MSVLMAIYHPVRAFGRSQILSIFLNEVTFRWIGPDHEIARHVTAPPSEPKDIFVPDTDGTGVLAVDPGNGQKIRKPVDVSFFVIPKSPRGVIAMVRASIATPAGYMHHKIDRHIGS
jgi:hypothetical protein